MAAAGLAMGQSYEVGWSSVAGGGGTSENSLSGAALSGTIGQAATTQSSGGGFIVTAGFWSSSAPASLGTPPLTISLSGGGVLVAWPAGMTGFSLEETASLSGTPSWTPVAKAPSLNLAANKFEVLLDASAPRKFLRLQAASTFFP